MTFYGSKELVEDDYSLETAPSQGESWTRRYRGGFTEVKDAYDSARIAGLRARMDPIGNGYWSLVVVYAGGTATGPSEILSEKWTMEGSDLEKSIWELPKVYAELIKITDVSALARVRAYIESFVSGEYIVQDQDGVDIVLTESKITDITNAYGVNSAIITGLIQSLSRGTEAKPVSSFVLRHTMIVPANSVLKPGYTNLGRMIGTGTLISTENIPSTILFNIPDGYWWKKAPTITELDSGRWQFTQDFVHADSFDVFAWEDAL